MGRDAVAATASAPRQRRHRPCTQVASALACTAARKPPLSSDAPRPYRKPSRSSGSNGGEVHFSRGSAGWMSSAGRRGSMGCVVHGAKPRHSTPAPLLMDHWDMQCTVKPGQHAIPDDITMGSQWP